MRPKTRVGNTRALNAQPINGHNGGGNVGNISSYDTEDEESLNSEDELLIPSSESDDGKTGPFDDTAVSILGSGGGSSNAMSSISAPVDRYNAIYIIFFIQGIGMLLPWNFFITAKSYFDFKFAKNHDIQSRFENAFALSAMFPNVISLFLNIFLTGKISRAFRIITCLIIMFLMFVLTTVLVRIDSHTWTKVFFAVTIVSVIVINLSAGIFQGTIFGVAGIMGSKYMGAIMNGQALAGIFAAGADLATKLADSSGKHPDTSAFIYFATAALVIVITAISYSVLSKLPRMQFYFQRAKTTTEKKTTVKKKEQYVRVPYFAILKQISRLTFSVTSVFAVTLSMFPAILSRIESVNKDNGSRWNNDLFPTLMCFLIFNCGDCCGRIIAGHVQIVSSTSKWLPVLCVSRVVFIPLFLMCKMEDSYLPTVLTHDAYPVVLNMLFSLSNGYFGSLCMMYGPRLVAIEYAETAGTIMSLFLTIGLTIGACISFLF